MDRLFFAVGSASAGLRSRSVRSAHTRSRRGSRREMLAVYETGVRYQMFHALALLAVAWAATRWPGWPLRRAGGSSSPGRCSFGQLVLSALGGGAGSAP